MIIVRGSHGNAPYLWFWCVTWFSSTTRKPVWRHSSTARLSIKSDRDDEGTHRPRPQPPHGSLPTRLPWCHWCFRHSGPNTPKRRRRGRRRVRSSLEVKHLQAAAGAAVGEEAHCGSGEAEQHSAVSWCTVVTGEVLAPGEVCTEARTACWYGGRADLWCTPARAVSRRGKALG